MILEIMAETLEDAAFDVLTASDGHEALSLLRATPDQFTMLISDIHMPGGVSGLEVAAEARRLRPGLPIILATGRPDVLDARWQREDGYVLLRKPYGPGQLTALVRLTLARSAG